MDVLGDYPDVTDEWNGQPFVGNIVEIDYLDTIKIVMV